MNIDILDKIKHFLVQAEKSPVPLSEELIEQFGEDCKKAIRKQFKEKRDTSFKVRMSGIGKPLCQLQMEKSGAKREEMPYNSKLRFLFGDMIEAITMLLLKASGTTIKHLSSLIPRAPTSPKLLRLKCGTRCVTFVIGTMLTLICLRNK